VVLNRYHTRVEAMVDGGRSTCRPGLLVPTGPCPVGSLDLHVHVDSRATRVCTPLLRSIISTE